MNARPELLAAHAPEHAPNKEETGRTIALGERLVAYALRRTRRRTIGLAIDHRGLRVGAPLRASLGDIEALIRQHADWVARKLDAWQHRQPPPPLRLCHGQQLPFLDGTVDLCLATGPNRALWSAPKADGETLTLCLRRPEDAPRLLEATLRARARELFADRLIFFTARLGLPVPPLALSSARTRWGSCSQRSGIRLNWRLIHFPRHLIDYVVAHEVAHLVEMNHSPRFWSVVARIYPDHARARAELRQYATRCPRAFAPPTPEPTEDTAR